MKIEGNEMIASLKINNDNISDLNNVDFNEDESLKWDLNLMNKIIEKSDQYSNS